MFKQLAAACIAAGALLTLSAAPAYAGVDDFVGQWTNSDPRADGVVRVNVTRGRGPGVRVSVFGSCAPRACEWGEVAGTAYAPSAASDTNRDANVIVARYTSSFATRVVILRLTRSGVEYEVLTEFTDRSRRSNYVETGRLQRERGPFPPGRPGDWGGGGGGRPERVSEDCTGFTPGNLQVVNIRGSWKIVDGSHWIADFGPNRAEADSALALVRRYGFTSQCFVGRPDASMTYWVRGDRVPDGSPTRMEDCLTINPANIQAQNVRGSWKIVDGSTWVLDFGANRSEAEQAAAIIRYHGITRQCFVGRPDPSMTYWLATR
ncbi:hypothetical protein [Terricaulis sp.]|uniref:hypothetical protein n=1 Tax=Terricaulis sp. TaxID=2768686 RepID=UPI003783A8B1